MLLSLHPQVRVQRGTIGREGAPLLVIDPFVADPDRLVRKAARSLFVEQGSMFPGVRAPAPLGYAQLLERALRPLLAECFGLRAGRLGFPMCHYSLVSTPPQSLAFLQRVPHIDSVSGAGLASVHYLFHPPWGGTAFYRHRRTGYEYVDEARRDRYFDCLHQESLGAQAPQSGYIDEDTALFERIASVAPAYNRLVVYRRNSLHSGRIDSAQVPPPDPLNGRLSINCFIDVLD